MQQSAALRGREDRDGVRATLGHQVRAFERIDRDVEVGPIASADVLADVQHRRFVPLAFADHDPTRERDGVHRFTHRVDGGGVGPRVVAMPQQVSGGDRGRLGDANKVEDPQLRGAVHGMLLGSILLPPCHSGETLQLPSQTLRRDDDQLLAASHRVLE